MDIYLEHYDEINAELQRLGLIAQEEEQAPSEQPLICIGSGEDQTIVLFGHNYKEITQDVCA